MFRKTYNLMKLKVKMVPLTPLLVASGKTFDVTQPDIQFIRVNTGQGETVYVPGSPIKGVLRAGMEGLLEETDSNKNKICITSEKMCHDKTENKNKKQDKKLPYGDHCPVCRTFGSGDMASRLEISDAFPFEPEDDPETKEKRIETIKSLVTSRSGIRIDRKTGKTKGGALFEYEILGGGELFGEFTFTNYQLYQPGMLFTLFDLARDGFLRFGHSKSRGLGVLRFNVEYIKILQVGPLKGDTIKGVGMLPGDRFETYRFFNKDSDSITQSFPCQTNALYTTFTFSGKEAVEELGNRFKACAEAFMEA